MQEAMGKADAQYMSMEDHAKFKYLLSLDGGCFVLVVLFVCLLIALCGKSTHEEDCMV